MFRSRHEPRRALWTLEKPLKNPFYATVVIAVYNTAMLSPNTFTAILIDR